MAEEVSSNDARNITEYEVARTLGSERSNYASINEKALYR